jgi:trk system potassium uptake protein TrkH
VLAVLGWTGLDPAMSLFEAVAHAFTTMPTGGFSTEARSLAAFGPATQWTVIVFMFLAGMNFALMFRALRRRIVLVRDEELRLYVAFLLVASTAVLAELAARHVLGGEQLVRATLFQVVSLMTTTGYATADFAAWPVFVTMVLVGLMFVGGSAGSTAGSVKVVRYLVLGRLLRRELDQTVHREVVVAMRVNRTVIDERTVRGVGAFILLYVVVFALGALALAVSEAVSDQRLHLTWAETVSAAATTLGNVGPGLGFLGPMGSFDSFAASSKAIIILLMWMGRLELLPVVVLFTRSYWRA